MSSLRQQSPRVQRPETSPRPRQASPRPVATPQRSDRQSFPRAPVTARERPKERQPSPRPVGAMTAREDRQSLVRERPTCRDRSASRQIPSPTPKSGQLTRSQSARRSLEARSPNTDPLNRSMSRGAAQRSGTHLGLRGLVSSSLQSGHSIGRFLRFRQSSLGRDGNRHSRHTKNDNTTFTGKPRSASLS